MEGDPSQRLASISLPMLTAREGCMRDAGVRLATFTLPKVPELRIIFQPFDRTTTRMAHAKGVPDYDGKRINTYT